jgi:hypothetical protein
MTTKSPLPFWQQVLAPRTPTYEGVANWYHVWAHHGVDSAPEFVAHLYVGQPTARRLKSSCYHTNVVTRFGQPV